MVLRTALVHDWLTGMRGGEKVLEALCDLFPAAPIFTLIHNRGSVSPKIESHPIRTSLLQSAPLVKTHYRNFLPFFPRAIERFQLYDFDLVISSSHCVAKGVIPSPAAVHVCYCHTPMRYIWSHYDDYFGKHRIGLFKRMILPPVRNYLCEWDLASNQRVDQFIANSGNVAGRIKKFYGRESKILYPPVDVDFFTPSDADRGTFYLIVSALVPYKRLDLAIETFNQNGKTLVIVGTGPEFKQLKKMSAPNIQFLGRVDAVELRELYRKAAALIQPGEEDFGINMIEALSCQCPVIGYGRGGVLESIVEGETGIFFNELSASALQQTIDKTTSIRFNTPLMRETAQRFSPARFKTEFQRLIPQKATVTNDGFTKK
jgi:glycosyltransferase involved in cell wall biosynthesis